ncbi:hypothetical protein HAPAU_36160 [Halalkalicoccus paucihalophilus]|uniref:Sulfatase n=1 Tax=Halalkalicoccus paucihalophilus TaxID=1008153 RepID=A0A151AAJ6_9EURY|nr:hypothetical protein [Halalkalicoccus paucihalophilus]KYH24633.1 hypothetical protein HAPAU_36160 [Halalkalicoccus paucihalophilus]
MTYRNEWAHGLLAGVRSRDLGEIATSAFYAYDGLSLSLTSRYPLGTNVFEKAWDVLVVLDACRTDALHEVVPEYSFLDDIGSIWSVGSTSGEWYAKTFVDEYREVLAETALISANPYAEHTLINGVRPPSHPCPLDFTNWSTVSDADLAYLEVTCQHNRQFDDISDLAPHSTTIQEPSYVTDRAIVAGREGFDKVVVHYFQPHRPFIHNLVKNNEKMTFLEDKPYDAGRSGEATIDDIWPLYLDNLRLVLDSVGELLENINGSVALTADHGELFGEFGQYGHFQSIPHPKLKKVPWVEMTGTDTKNRQPDRDFSTNEEYDVEEQLVDLGYR